MPSNFHANDDDKYAKFASKGQSSDDPIQKYNHAVGLLNFKTVPLHLFVFAFFVLATGLLFTCIGGVFDVNLTERFFALQLEILGLLMLRHKIDTNKSVGGISGMTFVMYTVVYFCRMGLALPIDLSEDFFKMQLNEWKDLDFDMSLGFVSFLLVLDILKKIFVTYRSTYEDQLDVLKAWYLIPACWTISLLVRPHFEGWPFYYGYSWSSTLNMDVLALMPQVVMMSQSGFKVASPVANFVAATSVSRCGDLMHSLVFLGETRRNEPFSYWTAVGFQMVHLVLVADFMYYFCKARAWAAADEISFADV